MTSKPPSFRRIDILKPCGTNFFSWRHHMLSELMFYNLTEYLYGPIDPPRNGDPNTLQDRITVHNNNIRHVSAFIMSSVHVNYAARLLNLLSEPWEMMKVLSGSCIENTHRNIGYYERQIHSLKLKDFNSLDDFIEELNNLYMCIEQAGRRINDTSKVSILLSALPSSFETIKTIIENRDNLTYEMAVQQLRMHLKENKNKNEESEKPETALKIQHTNLKCFVCGRKGHTARFCYKNPNRIKNNRENHENKVPNDHKRSKKQTKSTNEEQKNTVKCHACNSKIIVKSSSESEEENDSNDIKQDKSKEKSTSTKNYRVTNQAETSDSDYSDENNICGNTSSAI